MTPGHHHLLGTKTQECSLGCWRVPEAWGGCLWTEQVPARSQASIEENLSPSLEGHCFGKTLLTGRGSPGFAERASGPEGRWDPHPPPCPKGFSCPASKEERRRASSTTMGLRPPGQSLACLGCCNVRPSQERRTPESEGEATRRSLSLVPRIQPRPSGR